MDNQNWFEVIQNRPYLYTIRERLDVIEPRFLTKYTNMYLLVGDDGALLFDTGSGLGNLTALVDSIIDDKDLTVVNSHNHFDHVGSNHQFEITHIHRWDFRKLMRPMDVSYLQGGNPEFVQHYEQNEWKIDFADVNIPLIGNEIFDLGGLTVELIYTPGHTSGSICMKSNHGELFTGDTIHYGTIFLPGLDKIPFYLQSLDDLEELVTSQDTVTIFPGHEEIAISPDVFNKFRKEFSSTQYEKGTYDPFLEAHIFKKKYFTFVRPTEKSGGYELVV